MSDPVRPPFLSTLLYPLPTRPLGIDEMPAYVFQYSPGHYYEGKYAIKVKVYKEGWYRGGKYDYKTYIGEYDTWEEAVLDMRRRRKELEKKTRSGTPAPTATVPPRRTKKLKHLSLPPIFTGSICIFLPSFLGKGFSSFLAGASN